jgi:hypothetical protein
MPASHQRLERINPNADRLDKINMNNTTTTCPECDRTFDLTDDTDSAEWHYGHDCEG